MVTRANRLKRKSVNDGRNKKPNKQEISTEAAPVPTGNQKVENETENAQNLKLTTLSTEEQVFSEDRSANDSLGG